MTTPIEDPSSEPAGLLGDVPRTQQSSLHAVLYVFWYTDRNLLALHCQMNGIPYSIATDETDFAAKLAATENAVGLVHFQHLAVAKRLRSETAFAETPFVILNSHSKEGRKGISEANLDPVCELEVPFNHPSVLKAISTFGDRV
jgi:hypothetical protein